MHLSALALLVVCIYGVTAQYNNGPVPPRLAIPGAIPLGPKPSNRQGRLLQVPQSVPQSVRIRRPGQQRAGAFKSVPAPSPFLQQLDDLAKPVNEDLEDFTENTTQQPFLTSTPSFNTPQDEPQLFLNSAPVSSIPQITPTRQPEPVRIQPTRPPQQPAQQSIRYEVPSLNKYDGPVRQQQQPIRLSPLSYRPQVQRPSYRPEPRPQQQEEEDEPIRQQPYRQPTARPQQQQQASPQKYTPSREKKPVAQVIRKYQETNPDGSITWGFENDDGSFKEETIGNDCVTRGSYGYVDPDGVKREYSYETGIPCDKAKEEQEKEGFIDYQENKAVLPNGIVLDLAAMGKKSKRPHY